MSSPAKHLPLGPVMVDLVGDQLTDVERARLLHPLVGGVILFARNFTSIRRLVNLTQDIRKLRQPALIVSVDHEGGRVQRFRPGFTRLPAMRVLGERWQESPDEARHLAEQTGYVMAAELRASGVDFSYAPVLDIDYGHSAVIGNRAFHIDPKVVASLSGALIRGMRMAGMHPCGKHFPGHGFVEVDSHQGLPEDGRSLEEIWKNDLYPYRSLIGAGLTAVMPAHVIYRTVDEVPAGFSNKWLNTILRGQLGFDGVIISDALDMEGAAFAGSHLSARVEKALQAGCDMVLATNKPVEVDEMLTRLHWQSNPVSLSRLARLHGEPRPDLSWETLAHDLDFQAARAAVASLSEGVEIAQWGMDVGEVPAA